MGRMRTGVGGHATAAIKPTKGETMSKIFIDTATSDRWTYGRDIPDTVQPHLVRLSWVLEADDNSTIRDASHLIRLPQGEKMASEAQHYTGIYQHTIESRGMKMFDVLTEFADALGEADLIVAHGWSGQKQVLERSLRYVGMPAREWPLSVDVMIKATNIVRIPAEGKAGFKWPDYNQCCVRFIGASYIPTMDPVADGLTRVNNVRIFFKHIQLAGLA